MPARAGTVFGGILLASAAAVGGLVWLIYLAVPALPVPGWATDLPAWNAVCNGVSALAALIGWLAIRRGRREWHRRAMLIALAASAAFLTGYVLYHHFHGETHYGGQGWLRSAYFMLLVSHILGSVALLPLLLSVLWLAISGHFEQHRGLARWVWPLWMYVSLTGVMIFFFLKPYY